MGPDQKSFISGPGFQADLGLLHLIETAISRKRAIVIEVDRSEQEDKFVIKNDGK